MRNTGSCFQTYRKAILLTVLAGASLLAVITSAVSFAEQDKRLDVLELFTSQGCSSCPPADALLRQLSKRANILALSFPVSYWDHLGWKDTLAKESFNERQRVYAEARGDRQIYTPQLIVNGMVHVVGSQSDEIEDAIKNTGRLLHDAWVPVSLRYDGSTFAIGAGSAPASSTYRSGQLWLLLYSDSVPVTIGRGENNGRTITYTNVVRKLVPVGAWRGQEVSYTLPTPSGASFDGIAVILQADKSYAVLGAASAAAPSQ